jgi:NADH-quinone oxidoreductase subunit A
MTELVAYMLLFLGVGVFFVFFHLLMGRFIRPVKPDPEKLTIYECGEPTVGSAWVQFDLRYYVVALLFVIFDVEVAFFFPWAIVFGKANTLANDKLPAQERQQLTAELMAGYHIPEAGQEAKSPGLRPDAAHELAWLAFWDILVFFGVLLVGFAYLWKRGDINWVRSLSAEKMAAVEPLPAEDEALIGSDVRMIAGVPS